MEDPLLNNRQSAVPAASPGCPQEPPPFLEMHRFSFNFDPPPGKFGVAVARGERNRPCADYLVLQELQNKILAAVLDGVGGSREPQGASYYAAEVIRDEIALHSAGLPDTENLRQALLEANECLRGDHCGSESTATALLLDCESGVVSWAAAGNTRLYHVHGSSVTQVTRDQGLGPFLFSKLGMKLPEIQVGSFSAGPGDMLFLCSDGVHEMVPGEEIEAVLLAPATPQGMAEALMMKVFERSAACARVRDDQGIIVMRIQTVNLSR